MKKLLRSWIILALFVMPSTAMANIINCAVSDDVTITMGGPAWDYTVIKPMTIGHPGVTHFFNMPGLAKFDVTGLNGITASQINSATFNFYAWQQTGAGPADTGNYAAYNNPITGGTWLGGDVFRFLDDWSEGGAAYPDKTAYTVEDSSSTYFVLGNDNWGSCDITDIVKHWAGDDGLYDDAYGILMRDRDEPIGNIALYFASKDWESTNPGDPAHPGEAFIPYLTVDYNSGKGAMEPVPIPGAFLLLGSGLVGLLGLRRRKKS